MGILLLFFVASASAHDPRPEPQQRYVTAATYQATGQCVYEMAAIQGPGFGLPMPSLTSLGNYIFCSRSNILESILRADIATLRVTCRNLSNTATYNQCSLHPQGEPRRLPDVRISYSPPGTRLTFTLGYRQILAQDHACICESGPAVN